MRRNLANLFFVAITEHCGEFYRRMFPFAPMVRAVMATWYIDAEFLPLTLEAMRAKWPLFFRPE